MAEKTDKEKLDCLAEIFDPDAKIFPYGRKLIFGGRRYSFNELGEVVKIERESHTVQFWETIYSEEEGEE